MKKFLLSILALSLLNGVYPMSAMAAGDMKSFKGSFVSFQYPPEWEVQQDDGPDSGIKSVLVKLNRYDECSKKKTNLLEFTLLTGVGPKEEYNLAYVKDSSMLLSSVTVVNETDLTQLGHIQAGVGFHILGSLQADQDKLTINLYNFLKMNRMETPASQSYFSLDGYVAGTCDEKQALTEAEQQGLKAFLESIEYHPVDFKLNEATPF